MDEQGRNEIKKMGEILGNEYSKYAFDSLTYANKKIDTFASLLIIIAFSSIGLSIQLLGKDNLNTEIIRWGIIFLVMSIIFGLTQLIIDYKFFIKASKLYGDIGSRFNLVGTGIFEEDYVEKALSYLERHKKLPNSSNICPLFVEVFFVFIGAILILYQLLF